MKPNIIRWCGLVFLLVLCWQGYTVYERTLTWQVPLLFGAIGLLGLSLLLWLAKAEQAKLDALPSRSPVIPRFR